MVRRITIGDVALALDDGLITREDLQDILDGWRPGKRRKGRRRIPYLKKAKRDFLINATFEYLRRRGAGSEAAKDLTAHKCGVSRSEVTRVLADQRKDIGELVPDDWPM
jgi:hypothetical protein